MVVVTEEVMEVCLCRSFDLTPANKLIGGGDDGGGGDFGGGDGGGGDF